MKDSIVADLKDCCERLDRIIDSVRDTRLSLERLPVLLGSIEPTRVVAQAAHDLGTPIAVLKLVPRMVREGTRGCATCAASIEQPLEALSIAVQTVQCVSANLLEPERKPQDRRSVHEAAAIARKLVQELHPCCVIRFMNDAGDPGPTVQGLTFVLANLLRNAAEASRPGSEIVMMLAQRRGWFGVRIEDTGYGIPEPVLAKIKTGELVTTKSDGKGLGLSAATEWATRHGARFEIQSRPELGTRIKIEIPHDPMRASS